MIRPVKVISGGQTGADRGGLDAAIDSGIEDGGWVPFGRRAEDGRVPYKYHVRELTTSDYPSRTRVNIEESDGTAIFVPGAVTPGSKLTLALCKELRKPHIVIRINNGLRFGARRLRQWLVEQNIHVLNVAGSRESKCPGIHNDTYELLMLAFSDDELEDPEENTYQEKLF